MRVEIVLRDIALSLDEAGEPEVHLRRRAAEILGVGPGSLERLGIVKRALDSRRRHPRYLYNVAVAVDAPVADRALRDRRAEIWQPPAAHRYRLTRPPDGPPPVVVGAGPAGLFAALTLAEAGWPPILLERGRPVESRARDVSRLYARGELDVESNVCFGEGGAGTFSDGKLYTRVNDPRVRRFLDVLVELGADPDIVVNSRPHVGTDRLVRLLEALRARLLALGATLRFETRVDGLEVRDGRMRAARLAGGEVLPAPRTVLATGHSARAMMEHLDTIGLPLEARPFAVGFRVEHPQALIDELRYGRFAGHSELPAADYRLAHTDRAGAAERGVYSFCMCPGGVVVATPTRPGELCINGMSHASRSGRYANSALVVTVGPEDFGGDDLFGGVRLQEAAERAAYDAGGGAFVAPAARLTDFVRGRSSSDLGGTSYRRGIVAADLATLYPAPIIEALRRAVREFDRSMHGFLSDEATLIGVETRTASPVRLPRGDDLCAGGAQGLYPAGEGLGYGGGIASAAIDGMRVAERILVEVGAARDP